MRCAAVIIAAALGLAGAGASASEGSTLAYEAHEATWSDLDLAPDGRTILFDLLGDIYSMPAEGGDAKPVLTGTAWERDAVLSPDGKWMAFISDRSGVTNLWIVRPDGSEARQLSRDTSLVLYTSPAWAPDGKSVYVSRAVHQVLAFELWRFALAGGEGEVLVPAQPSGNEGWDERINALGTAPTPDGKAVYYATKLGHTWTEDDPPNWSVARKDLASGMVETIVPGGMRPVLSADGIKLAYAARFGAETGIRLRNLETGEDKWLLYPVDRDGQEGGYYYDLLPRYEFTPDGKALMFSRSGTFHRLDLASDKVTALPFAAPVSLALERNTRVVQKVDSGPVVTHLAEGAVPSPDGKRIAFTALGSLFLKNLEDNTLVQLHRGSSFRPFWDPDGTRIYFVTWSAAGSGQIMSISPEGGPATVFHQQKAYWSEVIASREGTAVIALRANHYDRLHAPDEIAPAYPTDIVRLPLDGGTPQVIGHGVGLKNLQQTADGHVWVQTPSAIAELGKDGTLKPRVSVVGKPMGQYIQGTAPVKDIWISPDGKRLLARAASQLHLLPMPAESAEAPKIDLLDPPAGHRKLTQIGADYAGWDRDGRGIYWAIGADWRHLPLAEALSGKDPETVAGGNSLSVEMPRAFPTHPQLLRGGTAITMDGGRIVADSEILIEGDRISAIAPSGTLTLPADTEVIDMSGKYVIPGLIDAHAHFFAIRRGVHDGQHWEFGANLAYGVTSALEVQPFTPDIFAYADRADIGSLVGPRIFSTGPGIFVDSQIDSVSDAEAVLTRYRDHYRTLNIKSYMVGDRGARQAVADASRKMGMMPTTEGAADLVLELTHAVDGFAGNEHSLPVTPIHDDVVRLFAASNIAYTPTFTILYGGGPALFADIVRKPMREDPKFRRFTPPFVISDDLRNRAWKPSELQTYARFAADAMRIRRARGLVGAGSHGEVQGLGLHWEMESFVAGGATPTEALEIATIDNARVIGRPDDLGSLTPGKLADLLVLSADPREDIANARKIDFVMRGGLLFDGETLAPIGRPGSAPPRWWMADLPRGAGEEP